MNWSPKRCELLNWFRSESSSLADAYEGAVRLLDDVRFPGRMHFIAHAVRDISDRLVYVLDPQLDSGRVQYEGRMDRIENMWRKLQTFEGSNEGEGTRDTVPIEYELARVIDTLVQEHRQRRQRPSPFELLFRNLMRKEPFKAEVNRRLVSDFKDMRIWFMSKAHFPARNVPQVDEDELQAQFSKFEGMLHSFVGNFFTAKTELDAILRQANQ